MASTPGERVSKGEKVAPDPKDLVLTEDDLIPDGALPGSTLDSLDHDAIASVVSNLARTVRTPANIALFGPWGSGKSSLYAMIRDRIHATKSGVVVVKYDAWKFGGSMLQRNFLFDVAAQLNISDGKFLGNLNNSTEIVRLRLWKFIQRNYGSLLLAMFIAVLIAVTYVAAMAGLAAVGSGVWKKEALKLIPSGVGVFGLITAALLFSNQTLASAVEKKSRSPLQDADQFSVAFNGLMDAVRSQGKGTERTTRLVVFIDELDRCSPRDVVTTLISLKTFLDHEDCVFVVAADRDVLREALDEAPQAKPVRENEPYYSTAGAFIDKIFQHQISLPPVRAEALTNFALGLADRQGGLWRELRESDRRAYEDVVYALVPAHVQSPRRVKILMNNFATTYRVIQARHLERTPDPSEVAVLTVLQTEFPALIQDLVHEPLLIQALVDPTYLTREEASENLKGLVNSYSPHPRTPVGEPGTESSATTQPRSPAGPLMTDEGPADPAKEQGARLKLNQQLDGYLGYIHGAGIPFPTLDLVYLQDAASVQGLVDPRLRQLVDVAHVYAVDAMAHEFRNATTGDRQAAIHFFATKANTTFGAARANLIELACRITETLDIDAIKTIAPSTAPTVLGEVRNGRWRSRATPGALLLGLLDPQSDPLDRLGAHADVDALIEHDVFNRILPTLPYLDAKHAWFLHRLLVDAYPNHPEPMHEAIVTLDPESMNRLWNDVGAGVKKAITALPSETPAPAVAAAVHTTVATAATSATEPEPDQSAPTRYEALLAAFAERKNPAENAAADALIYGINAEQQIYDKVYLHLDELFGTVIVGPTIRNEVALAGLIAGASGNAQRWTAVLAAGGEADHEQVREAVERLCNDLKTPDELASHEGIVETLKVLENWITDDDATSAVSTIREGLLSTPYTADTADAGSLRRASAYEMLDVLNERLPDGTVDQIRLDDIAQAIAGTADLTPVMNALLDQTARLSQTKAEELDSTLATNKTSDQFINRTRLRVCARQTTGKPPIRANVFLGKITEDVLSTTLVAEWLASNPSVREVQSVAAKATISAATLHTYAKKKSVGDRSKLWISLHNANFHDAHLAAVGRLGIDGSVIDSLASDIIAADLKTQRTLVDTLLTGDASHDSSARKATSNLALGLLATGKIGVGQSAATLIIRAGGAGNGMTQSVRRAFDDFTAQHANSINKGDLRKLNALNLFTKKKSSPMALWFDWFGTGSGL